MEPSPHHHQSPAPTHHQHHQHHLTRRQTSALNTPPPRHHSQPHHPSHQIKLPRRDAAQRAAHERDKTHRIDALLAIRKWGREMLVCAVSLLVHRCRRVEGYEIQAARDACTCGVVRVHERAPSTESVPMLEREREATVQDRPIHLLSPGFKTLGIASSLPSRCLFPSRLPSNLSTRESHVLLLFFKLENRRGSSSRVTP